MQNNIVVKGICTNNLKNIDVELVKDGVNLLLGPSGSGKSSLAYETIAQIGQHEFFSLFADDVHEPTYKVNSFYNMLPTVPIKQINNNNNIRSTIGTYFGISHKICLLYSSLLNIDDNYFSLSKEENLCEKCHGLGVISELDITKVVSPQKKIKDNPFRCWNKYKDFFAQIISLFCKDNGINTELCFYDLTKSQQDLLLFGTSKDKYTVKYKKVGRIARRTTPYYGVFTGRSMLTNFSISKGYYSNIECDCCHGMKYSLDHQNCKLCGTSIGEFLTLRFDLLLPIITNLEKDYGNKGVGFILSGLRRFIEKAIELKLGHLYFNRSIPTLSGGEMQRLKLVQVFNTQLSNLLLVLDEPLAGLSQVEKPIIQNNIAQLALHNTILIIDHGTSFLPLAKKVFCLGPSGGDKGGQLIDANEYLNLISKPHSFTPKEHGTIIELSSNNSVYRYNGFSVNLMKNAMNLIIGASGVGKSTLLREYFPKILDDYCYINQKTLVGNKNSNVATALDLAPRISNLFAKKHKKDAQYFSNHTGNPGCCAKCFGAGYLEYGDLYCSDYKVECNECNGTGFSKDLIRYCIEGKTILDIWQMTIDDAKCFFEKIDKKIYGILSTASSLLLGHLKIGQPSASLSGGESIRVKLLREASSKSEIIGIDEPFKGLNATEQYAVGAFLDDLRQIGKTIVVIDHTEKIDCFFSHKQTIVEKNNTLIGVYQ